MLLARFDDVVEEAKAVVSALGRKETSAAVTVNVVIAPLAAIAHRCRGHEAVDWPRRTLRYIASKPAKTAQHTCC